jgi:hypothetical protein
MGHQATPSLSVCNVVAKLQARCHLLWEPPADRQCGTASPVAGILSALERKRRVFTHSPTTFWKLGSHFLNRSLAPFEEWRPPFVVEDVFLPAPKTCSGCTETLPKGAHVSCWQAASYMHCRCAMTALSCIESACRPWRRVKPCTPTTHQQYRPCLSKVNA